MKTASLILVGILAAFVVFWPALGLEYWTDDFDHLQEVAGLKIDRLSFTRFLFLPHNEHIVPVLRLQDLYVSRRWGFEAEPAYALAIIWFGLCAGLTGLLARKMTGSNLRGLAAALLFAAAGTMSTMLVTVLTAMMFTQALACYLLALMAEKPSQKVALCAMACLCFPGSFPFAAAVAAASWPRWGWRAGAAWIALTAVVLGYHRWAHWMADSPSKPVDLSWAPAGLWLPLTAPFRLFWSWTGLAAPSPAVIAAGGGVLWALGVLLGWRRLAHGTRWMAASLLAGAVLQSLLTGAGRGSAFSTSEFFQTDRYYAFFLAPVAITLACSAPRHWAIGAAAAGLLLPARIEMNRQVRESLPYTSPLPLDQARKLASMAAEEIRREPDVPFRVRDEFVRIPGIHKGGMFLSTVIYISYPEGLPGMRFVPQVAPLERKRLDELLYRWRIFEGL